MLMRDYKRGYNMKKKFIYETHTHTKEGSACTFCKGVETARAHKEAGYTGIIITNHFFYGNTAVDRTLTWEDWVAEFCSGYYNAKQEGDRIGLQVFLGWESGYQGTEFLVYGLDEKWLFAHPEIKDATVEEQYHLVKESGGLVVHAHPFREEAYIPQIKLYPEYIDAVEAINAAHSCPLSKSHRHPEYNTRAIVYARQHNLPMTAGSDTHSTTLLGSGMAFERKLADVKDFIKAVINREPYELLSEAPEDVQNFRSLCIDTFL
jgi:histidinol phosphatase-like PHP family hydrolase